MRPAHGVRGLRGRSWPVYGLVGWWVSRVCGRIQQVFVRGGRWGGMFWQRSGAAALAELWVQAVPEQPWLGSSTTLGVGGLSCTLAFRVVCPGI